MLTQATIKSAKQVVQAMKELLVPAWITDRSIHRLYAISTEMIEGEVFALIVNDPEGRKGGIVLTTGEKARQVVTLNVLCQIGHIEPNENVLEEMREATAMTAVWSEMRDVPFGLRALPAALGFAGGQATVVPELAVRPAGKAEREMRPPELRLMHYVLCGLIRARDLGLTTSPGDHRAETLRTLRLRGDIDGLDVSGAFDRLDFRPFGVFENVIDQVRSMEYPDEVVDGDPAKTSDEIWREAGMQTSHRLMARTLKRWIEEKEPAERYFGKGVTLEHMFEEYARLGVELSYAQWLAANVVDPATEMTMLDTALAESTSRLERAVLEAWRATMPTLWRIDDVTPGVSVRIVDIVDGTTRVVTDRGLASSVHPNLVFPGVVFRAGDYWFFISAGPLLSPMQVAPAIDFLEHLGLPLTRAALQKAPHLLGRLYAWIEESDGPTIESATNTDGEKLVLGEDHYEAEDADDVRDALDAMPDVDYDSAQDLYLWFKEEAQLKKTRVAPRTLLAHLRLVEDEIFVEANSDERRAALRARLEALPGVRFRGFVRAEDMPRDASPMPEPMPRPDEIDTSEIRATIEGLMMDWLDRPIPALDGKTPRQCAKTKKGAAKVRTMILSMPAPYSTRDLTIEPPREAMLRELGL